MSRKLKYWLVFLIFLNGYISLSLELVVLRQLSFWVGSSTQGLCGVRQRTLCRQGARRVPCIYHSTAVVAVVTCGAC